MRLSKSQSLTTEFNGSNDSAFGSFSPLTDTVYLPKAAARVSAGVRIKARSSCTDCKPWHAPRGRLFTFSATALSIPPLVLIVPAGPWLGWGEPAWPPADPPTPPAAGAHPPTATGLPASVTPKLAQMKLGSLNIRAGLNHPKTHHELSCDKGLNHPSVNQLFAYNEKFKIKFLCPL